MGKKKYLAEDLVPRLKKAASLLELYIEDPGSSIREKYRLEGKLEGVRLAISYAEEELR